MFVNLSSVSCGGFVGLAYVLWLIKHVLFFLRANMTSPRSSQVSFRDLQAQDKQSESVWDGIPASPPEKKTFAAARKIRWANVIKTMRHRIPCNSSSHHIINPSIYLLAREILWVSIIKFGDTQKCDAVNEWSSDRMIDWMNVSEWIEWLKGVNNKGKKESLIYIAILIDVF